MLQTPWRILEGGFREGDDTTHDKYSCRDGATPPAWSLVMRQTYKDTAYGLEQRKEVCFVANSRQ